MKLFDKRCKKCIYFLIIQNKDRIYSFFILSSSENDKIEKKYDIF